MHSSSTSSGSGTTTKTFKDSCKGYDETCSDANHQGPLVCVDVGGTKPFICAYIVPAKNSGNEGYRIGPSSVVWDPADKQASLGKMKLLLAAGHPLVLGYLVTPAWDAASDDGYMRSSGSGTIGDPTKIKPRGGHGTHVVGFIENDTLAKVLPSAPPGAGGGYFIVKNSWGACWGDGGFIYVPYASLLAAPTDVTMLESVK
jgi:hypothetical protein